MRKIFILFILLLSFVFTGCTVQDDNLTSIKRELSALNEKVTQLEEENSKLRIELLQIKTEPKHTQSAIDEPDSINESVQTLTPTPEPTQTSTPTPAPTIKATIQPTEKKDITVYVTKTGAKYHSSGCRYLSKSKISINLSSAKNSYSACSVCNPPR